MTTTWEGLLGVICLLLVLILMLAVTVVLLLVLILCGNQIWRVASSPVFGIDVGIDVSAGNGIWRWRRYYYYHHMLTRCKWGLGDVDVANKLEGLLVFLCLVLVLALMISVAFVATKLEGPLEV